MVGVIYTGIELGAFFGAMLGSALGSVFFCEVRKITEGRNGFAVLSGEPEVDIHIVAAFLEYHRAGGV